MKSEINHQISNEFYYRLDPPWTSIKKSFYDKLPDKDKEKYKKADDTKELFTYLMNNLSEQVSTFYEGSFQLFESTMFEKLGIVNEINDENNLDLIIDKFGLPMEFKILLNKNSIKNLKDFENSNIYKTLINTEIIYDN